MVTGPCLMLPGGQCNDGHWKGIMVLGKNDSPGDTAFLDKWFPFFKIKK